MPKFKSTILNFLKNGENIDEIFNNLESIQKSLMKNHSNPVFSEEDKIKISNSYNEVDDLGKALYKYNTLIENEMPEDAEKENEEISDFVLKGGISNVKYVWHSENGENTCEECKALDGTEYDFDEEVPQRPHPNCKCTVEVVEDKTENTSQNDNSSNNTNSKKKNETSSIPTSNSNSSNNTSGQNEGKNNSNIEACPNCVGELEQAENILYQLYSSLQYAGSVIRKLIAISSISQPYLTKNYLIDLVKIGEESFYTYNDFVTSYATMVQLNKEKYHEGAPEYFHRLANCKAAQRGELGVQAAKAAGAVREIGDFYKEILFKGISVNDAIYNNNYDYEQNQIGRELGQNNPDADCEKLLQDMMKLEWFNKNP